MPPIVGHLLRYISFLRDRL